MDVSIEAVRHLQAQVASLKKYDYENVNREYKTISELEENGDEMHRALVKEIVTGSYFGGIREDFLTLLERIDSIADEAKDAGKTFYLRHVPKATVDYLFRRDVEAFIAACLKTTELFRESIIALRREKVDILAMVDMVERSEEEADTIRYGIIENLLRNEIDADVLDIVMLKDFLNTADGIADNAENGSDVLEILVAKGYT